MFVLIGEVGQCELCILHTESACIPHAHMKEEFSYVQNKKCVKGTWQELAPGDSQLGQLLQYMLGAHLRHLKLTRRCPRPHHHPVPWPKPKPIAGLFINGEMVYIVMSKLLGYFSY